MATLKVLIRKDKQRSDGTWNVVVRLTHNRATRYISTTMYVTKEDLTKTFNIKNRLILDRSDVLLLDYRKKLNKLNLEFNDIDIDVVVDYLKSSDAVNERIDFVEFSNSWMEKHHEIKSMRCYKVSLIALCKFMGSKHILCEEITVKTMKAFEKSLEDRPRAQSMYTSRIVRLFREARDYYNDEDNDIIRIKHSLSKYKPPHNENPEKRALTVEEIRSIFDLPHINKTFMGQTSLHDLAKDCFMLSFCLLGINSVDLHQLTYYDGDNIIYNRAKTRDRRSDKAKIVVRVPNIIKSLFEKYRGIDHVFNFSIRYGTDMDFNQGLNKGLKLVGARLGIESLQYYSARHSMATIAINEVGIDKYTVNDMLCHLDPSMRVTEMYIKKDFRNINEANRKLMEYVFGEGSY